MSIVVLGIDLGKNVCSIVGLDGTGRVVVRRRLTRERVIELTNGLPRCIMAMEACCGAHHLGRLLAGQGHEVRLMSPEYVRPYVKAHKNDDRDAEAIAEAATRPTMRFVELKSEEQLDMQSLHRVRDRLVGERTDQPAPGGPDGTGACGATRSTEAGATARGMALRAKIGDRSAHPRTDRGHAGGMASAGPQDRSLR